jgi:hypothetical protein
MVTRYVTFKTKNYLSNPSLLKSDSKTTKLQHKLLYGTILKRVSAIYIKDYLKNIKIIK